MKTTVERELGMERGRQEVRLTNSDDRAVVQGRKDLDLGTNGFDERSANEDRVERFHAQDRDGEVGFERIELATERVATHFDVHQLGERVRMTGHLARDEDRTGTRSPHRHALGDARPKLWDEAVVLGELADGRALATGYDERVDVVELLRPAHVHGGRAQAFEGVEVLAEVSLKSEDAGPG